MSTRRNPVIVGAVVAALVLVALLGWWVVTDEAEPPSAPTPSAPTHSSAPSAGESGQKTTKPPAPRAVEPEPVPESKRGLTDPAPLAAGATAEVTRIESVRSSAELPGEVSAPALRFTIEATAGDQRLDLTPVVVNAYYGPDRTPAIAMGAPGADPFSGRLAPGTSATGVFVFNVPVKERDLVYLEYSWSPKQKPVILAGDVS